jgi:hypothetical protein
VEYILWFTECLEELGYLIETYGISICQPSPQQALKAIAGQISERDNGVRNAALNSTVIAYLILGDNLYKYIGTVSIVFSCVSTCHFYVNTGHFCVNTS